MTSLAFKRCYSRKGEKGYMLAVVAVFTTILLVTLSAAMINWQKAIQREEEEELIFRGKQFMRAIELWQRKFPGTYPTTIDALLSTNNTRFLRKKWKDPITRSDDWRLIKMNPDGSVSGLNLTPAGGGPLGQSAFGSSTTNTQGRGTNDANLQRRAGLNSTNNNQSPFNSVLGGILGIASKSKKESLKTYNGRTHYNEWEFVYVPRASPNPVAQPGGGSNQRPGTLQPRSTPSTPQPMGNR
jgi:type II secretory pathway pseudopilin PulG